jgi:integrase
MSRYRQNIRLADAVNIYLERITNEGQAERSVYTAKYALRRFQKAVAASQRKDPNPYVHTMTPDQLDEYFFGRNGVRKHVQAVSFNRYRSVLKVFFDYAVIKRWTDENPMVHIGRAKPDAPKNRLMLSASELLRLLDNAGNPIQRVACSIGMNTGLRGNDIRHLTIFDANLESGVLQTEIRKTRKLDLKPITTELHFEIRHWLNTYADLLRLDSISQLQDDWFLVPSYYNNPQDFTRVVPRPKNMHTEPWRLVQRPLERMGYPAKGEGFHTLRRSSARCLFESLRERGDGRDHALMVVKEFLNHSSVTQTEHYLGLSHERTIRDTLLRDKPFLTALAQSEQDRVSGEGKLLSG